MNGKFSDGAASGIEFRDLVKTPSHDIINPENEEAPPAEVLLRSMSEDRQWVVL